MGERVAFLPPPPGRAPRDPLEILRPLLERGLHPDFPFLGRPLLHRACETGNLALAEFLFANAANLHAKGEDGTLPLEVASWHGHAQIVRLLLLNGSCFGRALHFATIAGELSIVELLLDARCPAHVRWQGHAPLDLAVINSREAVARLLLRKVPEHVGATEKLSPQLQSRYSLGNQSR